jgi:DNA-binding Xre family transcriptional regulator
MTASAPAKSQAKSPSNATADLLAQWQVRWKLGELLARHRLTALALAKASGLSKTTVYNLVNGQSKALEIETLLKIVAGFRALTGQTIAVDDIFGVEAVVVPAITTHPSLEEQLRHVKPFRWAAMQALVASAPDWTDEERAQWEAGEAEREAQRLQDRQHSIERERKFLTIFNGEDDE